MDERGLGKRLQEARQSAGLTQQQLCAQANLSFSTLTKIERGAIKSPSIFTIQSIAGALRLSLDELVGQITATKQLHKTKSGVSFVYFDVNGCLVHFFQRAFGLLATDTGIRSDIVEQAFWHLNEDANRGNVTLAEFNANLAKRLGIDEVKWQDYYLAAVEPVTEMQELLQWASERYQIGLLTNITPGLLSGLRRANILPNLNYDAIVDSSEVGSVKPEPKMYEIAQAAAGRPTNEILLIDDDRANLMAAEKLGWHVLSFDDARIEESVALAREVLEPAD